MCYEKSCLCAGAGHRKGRPASSNNGDSAKQPTDSYSKISFHRGLIAVPPSNGNFELESGPIYWLYLAQVALYELLVSFLYL